MRKIGSSHFLIGVLGLAFAVLYLLLLYYRPSISWYDETYWTDLGRQIGINGRYYTTVWGGGQPSYPPLYSYILALWFKLFGFSFFQAHVPAILMGLGTFYLIEFSLVNQGYINSSLSIVLLAFLFWISPHMYYSINCGRVEALCILTGTLTVQSYLMGCKRNGNLLSIAICSFLVMSAGFQGAVFSSSYILIYLLFSNKKLKEHAKFLFAHFFGYALALICISLFMWQHNCFRAFLRTTFGFSNTINIIEGISNFFKGNGFHHNDITFRTIESSTSVQDFLSGLTINGLSVNKEYLVLLLLLLVVFVIVLARKRFSSFSGFEKATIMSSVAIPFIFILLGRYATYYAWTPFLPCICAFSIIVQKLNSKLMYIIPILGITIWFVMCKGYPNQRNFDFSKTKDSEMLNEIKKADIKPQESCLIPYSWYYYLINDNENLFFPGSGFMPDNLSRMILCPPYSELESMVPWLEYKNKSIRYLYDIGDKKVFSVSSNDE